MISVFVFQSTATQHSSNAVIEGHEYTNYGQTVDLHLTDIPTPRRPPGFSIGPSDAGTLPCIMHGGIHMTNFVSRRSTGRVC